MKSDEFLVSSIFENIANIEDFTKDATEESFAKNIEKQFAVYKALENIGEASKKLSDGFKKEYPQIEWRKIAGLRDKLTHEYFGIDVEKVWLTVSEEIPKLKKMLKEKK